MKPKHQGGYSALHAELCERTLVTLLRGLSPWKASIYLVGGLVPRYLIPRPAEDEHIAPHVGTTDVDLMLDLSLLANVDAYRSLEKNLQVLGFARGKNDQGQAQHFSWRKPMEHGVTVVVDLLCDAPLEQGGRVQPIEGERRLSALKIPGAYLVTKDFVDVELTAQLLDERGDAHETVRIAHIVSFLILKILAYDDRMEEKDAYDIVYCLEHFGDGPVDVADRFIDFDRHWPGESLLLKAIDILNRRFASDPAIQGA